MILEEIRMNLKTGGIGRDRIFCSKPWCRTNVMYNERWRQGFEYWRKTSPTQRPVLPGVF
jgi:hypothetical protein